MKRLLSTIISVVACISVSAQGTCVINGNIDNVELNDGKKVKKVFLTGTDKFGQPVTVAEAKVKKGSYTFKYELAQDEPVLLYTVTGFGDGKGIEIFVEPGEVTVNTPSAAQPCGSKVSGTPVNDTYSEYKSILMNGCAGDNATMVAIGSREDIKTLAQAIRFLIDNNASPMMPLVVERDMLHLLTPAYAEQMMKAVASSLYDHPYYHSLRNSVLANSLKVGNEAPDITLPMLGGETKQLKDFRGRYVVLNFWASACEKSAEMLAEFQSLYEVVKESNGEFVIISVAIDDDKAVWEKAVKTNGLDREGWLHACDGVGAASPAAKLFGVEKTPKIVLIEPEGRAVSLDMEFDEVVMRVEQILMGDLYYLDQVE